MSVFKCILYSLCFFCCSIFEKRETSKTWKNWKSKKWPERAQNYNKAQLFFQAHHTHQKTNKITSIAKLNSVGWFLRNLCGYEIKKYQEKLKNSISLIHMNEITFTKWSNWRSWRKLSNANYNLSLCHCKIFENRKKFKI